MIPEPQDSIPLLVQPLGSSLVLLYLIGMLSAVQFDDKAVFGTTEVYNVGADKMLASELEPIELATAKKTPQATFRIRLIGA